jgi:hypothetical protein
MSFTFYRWFRSGIAASLPPPPAAGVPQRAAMTVSVEVGASGSTGPTTRVANVALEVLGPGDVTGIDGRQVIRMFPVDNTLDFEPTYFAHVEFDRPDLPWLFTPCGAAADGTLVPWIALVVVEEGDNATFEPGVPLSRLTVIGDEVAQLPSLEQAHAWAHVQITGDTSSGPEQIAEREPARTLSRLVCPRTLDPGRSYLACVVPTFKAGALAGLGQVVPNNAPVLAWTGAENSVELPVFHSWRFTTGGAGDFRTLVQRIQGRRSLAGVGTRPLDITDPKFGLPTRAEATSIPLGGVFKVDEPAAAPVDTPFASDLAPVINVSDEVAPPIYARWHMPLKAVETDVTKPLSWGDVLNLDARYRVAAGLGTQVVQEHQEDLMAAVWEQLGEILRANQHLRQAQLAVAAAERVVARHITPLSNEALLLLTGPAAGRLRSGTQTVRGAIVESCMPLFAVSGAFRKLTRARGPLDRKLGRGSRTSLPDTLPAPTIDLRPLVTRMGAGAYRVAPPALPAGAIAIPRATGPAGSPLGDLAKTFARWEAQARPTACSSLAIGDLAQTIRDAIVPDVAVAGRARLQIAVPKSPRVRFTNRLDPIMAAPTIPTPMILPLQELGQEWLLPGIQEVPPNTTTLVQPDTAFIEAYMVGLNHEMAREMLWRGFPTDQRGTVFARFWDRRGSVPTTAAPVPQVDIPPIHQWDPASALGEHMTSAAANLLVLLVRADLLHRYPRTTIFAQRSRWQRDAQHSITFSRNLALREPVPLATDASWTDDTRFPVFIGHAGADILFLGFPLSKEDVSGLDRANVPASADDNQAGWYIVFQEQPTEPRFGPTANLPPAANLRSESLAAQLLRPAFRMFVHGSDLITT